MVGNMTRAKRWGVLYKPRRLPDQHLVIFPQITLSLAVRALQQGLRQTRRRTRVLSTYLDFSRMVGLGTGDDQFRSYSGRYSYTTTAECFNL
jgi:hypothetical protein